MPSLFMDGIMLEPLKHGKYFLLICYDCRAFAEIAFLRLAETLTTRDH
jgi:hypothetical protein